MRGIASLLSSSLVLAAGAASAQPPLARPSLAEVLEASAASDWQPLDPDQTLVLELEAGRVVIALAPRFAPRHVANIQRLVRDRYFDGLAVVRSQDNYVVQWGDPEQQPARKRGLGEAAVSLPLETGRQDYAAGPFTALRDPDAYAPEVGFADGFPAARDEAGVTWLAHCYGMVGVARDTAPDSGNGSELYVVNGHAPRHLDRNTTLVGRVVSGMPLLSTLARGTGPLGFYETAGERVAIHSVRLASELPPAERPGLEALRTDSASFEAVIAARRHRGESWFREPVDRVELCNVPLPVREITRAR